MPVVMATPASFQRMTSVRLPDAQLEISVTESNEISSRNVAWVEKSMLRIFPDLMYFHKNVSLEIEMCEHGHKREHSF